MRRSFLWRYRVVLASGLLLLLAAHLLSVGGGAEGAGAKAEGMLMELMRPLQVASSDFERAVSGIYQDYFGAVGVREQNEQLRRELARLQSADTRIKELELENRRLADLLELKQVLGLNAVAATVIGSDATGLARTLLIDQGQDSGLRRGMPVVSNQGVVGEVITAGPNASKVLLIDDHNAALDALDQRSRARGIIAGVPEDGMVMKYVERTADVRPGDAIVSSGLDGIFPRGLLVGHVTRAESRGSGMFLNVELEPAVKFREIEQVLVVTQPPPQLAEETKG